VNFAARLTKLESRAAELPKSASAKDAADCKTKIIAMAEQFEDADQFIPALERSARFSKAQELSWVMRFGTLAEFQTALDEAVAYAKGADK
jgi:hypothetical protein